MPRTCTQAQKHTSTQAQKHRTGPVRARWQGTKHVSALCVSMPIALSQIGVPYHLGMLCARSCTLVCHMHMSGVFDLIHGDCWRNKVRNISARAQTICRLFVVFPLPLMFNVVLHGTVARWGQTRHVNYATPTPSRACQHWMFGARGSDTLACLCFVCCVTLPFVISLMLRTLFRQPSVFCLHRVLLHVSFCWFGSASRCLFVSLCSLRVFSNATHCAHDAWWETHRPAGTLWGTPCPTAQLAALAGMYEMNACVSCLCFLLLGSRCACDVWAATRHMCMHTLTNHYKTRLIPLIRTNPLLILTQKPD